MPRVEDPTQRPTLTLQMPNPLVLPVSFDENGRAYPAAGVAFQRMLTVADLDAMGVTYQWQTQDGKPFDHETARHLVRENEELAQQGIMPKQLMAHPNGDRS